MNAPVLVRTCSLRRSLDIVGDAPTLLILEASWLGAYRFDQMRTRTGLLQALISDRLKRLVEAGLLEQRRYRDRPVRYDYTPTAKGRDLYWTLLMMLRWEWNWGAVSGKSAVSLTHRPCGQRFRPDPACGYCGEPIDATQVEWTPGLGAGSMAPSYSRRRQRGSARTTASLMTEAVQIVGDRWAGLILWSIFAGVHRFDDLCRDLAIATNILSARLKWLETIGMVRPRAYRSLPPRREYRLTRKGVEYYPILLMLMRWGDRHYGSPAGPPVRLQHTGCGHALDARIVCSVCRQPIRAEDVAMTITARGGLPDDALS